ncbi:MAG: haloacid dehalogenase type II, partial [Alphaproteobacteria bacterium]|nr:haloacid dehalogenase type II [Alphaproteobacteria bacterium]
WINRNGLADEYADCPPKAIYKTLDGLLGAPN